MSNAEKPQQQVYAVIKSSKNIKKPHDRLRHQNALLTLAHACSRFVEVSEVLFGVSEVLFEVSEVLFEVLHRHCSRLLTLAHGCSRLLTLARARSQVIKSGHAGGSFFNLNVSECQGVHAMVLCTDEFQLQQQLFEGKHTY